VVPTVGRVCRSRGVVAGRSPCLSVTVRALVLAPFAERYLQRLRRSLAVVYDSWTESRRLHGPEEQAACLGKEEASILVVEADFVCG